MSAAAPTREQLLALYRAHLAAARSFVRTFPNFFWWLTQTSYNFREYFVRHTRQSFRAHLSEAEADGVSGAAQSASTLSRLPTAPKTEVSGASPQDATPDLAAFYAQKQKELKVLQRAAVTNMMYAGDRLVVEDAAPSRPATMRTADE